MNRAILILIIYIFLTGCVPIDTSVQEAGIQTEEAKRRTQEYELSVVANAVATATNELEKTQKVMPSLTATETQTVTACVTADKLNVRAGPGITFEVVTGLSYGQCVEITEVSPDKEWFMFEAGWISATYMRIQGETRGEFTLPTAPASMLSPTKKPIPLNTSPPKPIALPPEEETRGNCHPSYPNVCIPPPPPDLDCGDIPYRRFTVLSPDPHRFDGDHDGIGCER